MQYSLCILTLRMIVMHCLIIDYQSDIGWIKGNLKLLFYFLKFATLTPRSLVKLHFFKPYKIVYFNVYRERTRMRVLSKSFERLKLMLPWVPADTKLSKLDTLRLAMTYINHLHNMLVESEQETEVSKISMHLFMCKNHF